MAYVYLHTKPNGEIFYVGKGNGYRAYDKNHRSQYWKRFVNKYGYNVSIFLDNISDEKALSVEKDLIEAIGLDNLVNFTEGGEGTLGYNHSEETKKKIGLANSGGTSWSKGRKFSKEHRDKISKAHKGKKLSKETRLKMSKAFKGRKPANMVKLIDTITGIKYESVSDYCRINNLNISMFNHHFNGETKVNKFEHIKRL